MGPSEEEARAGLQRKRPRANPGEVVLGARESFLELPRVRPREVVLRARESFLERPRVRPGEVVLGVRESFPDEPEAAIERRRILPNLLLKIAFNTRSDSLQSHNRVQDLSRPT